MVTHNKIDFISDFFITTLNMEEQVKAAEEILNLIEQLDITHNLLVEKLNDEKSNPYLIIAFNTIFTKHYCKTFKSIKCARLMIEAELKHKEETKNMTKQEKGQFFAQKALEAYSMQS